ncbi:hypothetical protein SULI_01070 [Saccharolobus solfataricus]|uniref:Uncharacterized protein n=3 Tax=Saccharolobus solfataricus TaxID=2287 RepID=Q97W31_SACS2|nr:hypothetical protein [Saccharolobus solfataricus]AAK42559.1 Hypothetical protein SSO2411 [Saccharolobus solfataricus P2]AKA72651.1 hypothetical protein SULB_0212 [Saccharolobus solfataricus]AKA75351.1 hypothetical protein SULC_0211 [Saccharolobus solfataricus]AKA78043.1 hypothetical protein SULA_0211 [Saccharolobus solfataricus]AZF67164.1 hypothetical protein SULG_01070 [Saccharolobus solfataricus]
MNGDAQSYLMERISIALPILEISVPCNTTCVMMTKYKHLLSIENFKAQLEILDSLINLIEDKIYTLRHEIEDKFSQYKANVNIDNLVYAIYKMIEEGGNMILGEKVYFGNKEVAYGEYTVLIGFHNLVEKIVKSDSNIRSLCDEIRYLSESTWEHFDKNIRRSLNES